MSRQDTDDVEAPIDEQIINDGCEKVERALERADLDEDIEDDERWDGQS